MSEERVSVVGRWGLQVCVGGLVGVWLMWRRIECSPESDAGEPSEFAPGGFGRLPLLNLISFFSSSFSFTSHLWPCIYHIL